MIESYRPLWIILGPLCLFCSASVFMFYGKPIGYALASMVGIVVCYYLRWLGLALAATLLAILTFFSPLDNSWWAAGMGLAFTLGWVITILSLEDFQISATARHNQQEADLAQLNALVKDKETEISIQAQAFHQSLDTEKKQLDTLAQSLLKAQSEIAKLKDLLQRKENSLVGSENKIHTLLHNQAQHESKLAELKHLVQIKEEHIRQTIAESEQRLQKYAEENEALMKNQKGADAKELWQAMRKAEGLYMQLRDQFEEKSATLDEVRRELFHAHETLLRQQKEEIEREFYVSSEEIDRLISHIICMENDYEARLNSLEAENQAYGAIIENVLQTR